MAADFESSTGPPDSDPAASPDSAELWIVPPGSRLEAALGDLATAQIAGKPAIEYLLPALPEREQEIIKLRNGLGGYPRTTFDNVGHVLDLSRERIRQLDNEAMAKLAKLAEEIRQDRG